MLFSMASNLLVIKTKTKMLFSMASNLLVIKTKTKIDAALAH